jgi:hypothetical protein
MRRDETACLTDAQDKGKNNGTRERDGEGLISSESSSEHVGSCEMQISNSSSVVAGRGRKQRGKKEGVEAFL